MAIDLVGLVSRSLTPQSVGDLARALGINEAAAQKLVAAAIPTVLASLATTAAAPGGAKKIADAVSNSDPDLLTKLAGNINGGNVRALNEGANLLGGLLGGSGLINLVGALSQHAGVPQPAAQTTIGSIVQAAIGAVAQQDPSDWSDGNAIAALLGSQKDAIAAALPGELKQALSATGLLAGLGSLAAAGTAAAPTLGAARAAAARAPATTRAAPSPAPAAPRPSRFPTWAIILIIVIVLVAIWWYMATRREESQPAKQGMLEAPIEFVLATPPGSQG